MLKKCKHSEKHIVVIEAFDIYEKTEIRCTLCGSLIQPKKQKTKMKIATVKTAVVLTLTTSLVGVFIPQSKALIFGIIISINVWINTQKQSS